MSAFRLILPSQSTSFAGKVSQSDVFDTILLDIFSAILFDVLTDICDCCNDY